MARRGTFRYLLVTIATLAAILLPSLVVAQGTGQIEGTLRDEQGGVLPGATVLLKNEDSGVSRTVVSESDGRYVFPALLPGRYTVHVELTGFAPRTCATSSSPSVSNCGAISR